MTTEALVPEVVTIDADEALVPHIDVARLEALPHAERMIALGAHWHGFAQRTLMATVRWAPARV